MRWWYSDDSDPMSALLAGRDGELLVLTLNRPDKANAMNQEMNDALVAHLEVATADPGVRAVVLASSGSRCFSAGADLKEFTDLERGAASQKRREFLVRTLLALIDFPKPLVAAVQAQALGAGCMLALLADEIVAADTAQLGMPEIKHGMASPIGLAIIVARGGRAVGHRLVQGGESIDGQKALELRLVDEIVPLAKLEKRAVERARALGALPGAAFQINKAFMNAQLRAGLEAARRVADAT
jgi:enoyl-CoA hydratase/carnithine racemase